MQKDKIIINSTEPFGQGSRIGYINGYNVNYSINGEEHSIILANTIKQLNKKPMTEEEIKDKIIEVLQ